MTDQQQADIIKIAAVVTAIPRWAGALMAADGVPVPPGWEAWWRTAALVLSILMAVAEGFAIAFVFNCWRNQQDKRSRFLLVLAVAMLVDFGLILTPYIVANVNGVELADVLSDSWAVWLWAAAVAASTGLVVGSVGYAQKEKPSQPAKKQAASKPEPVQAGFTCESCGQDFASQGALNAHGPARCAKKLATNGKEPATELAELEY